MKVHPRIFRLGVWSALGKSNGKFLPQTTAQVMPQNDLYLFVGAEC